MMLHKLLEKGLPAIGSLTILSVAALGLFIISEALGILNFGTIEPLFVEKWQPGIQKFGLFPLIVTTLLMALLAGLLVIPVGVTASLSLIFLSRPWERSICEAALNIMSGLPSVLVGLMGLQLLTPVTGFSLITGVLTLSIMIFPTFTLVIVATLRTSGTKLLAQGRSLGMTDRSIAWGPGLSSIKNVVFGASGLSISRAMGEATAVALVIGKVSLAPVPDIFGPAHSLTTAILSDHPAASGVHYHALYSAATVLGLMIIIISISTQIVRNYLEEKSK